MSKKKMGRPLGGKSPEVIREYWRVLQRQYRLQMNLGKVGQQIQRDLGLTQRKRRKK